MMVASASETVLLMGFQRSGEAVGARYLVKSRNAAPEQGVKGASGAQQDCRFEQVARGTALGPSAAVLELIRYHMVLQIVEQRHIATMTGLRRLGVTVTSVPYPSLSCGLGRSGRPVLHTGSLAAASG